MQQLLDQQPSTMAPAAVFTGDAWWNVIYAGQEPSRARLNHVRFAPGARTNWHSHVLGQTLHVVAGIALIGTRDGVIIEARPGETVTCPPSEDHWHGATPDQFMEHLALWEGDGTDKPETTWLEPVTDERTAVPAPGTKEHAGRRRAELMLDRVNAIACYEAQRWSKSQVRAGRLVEISVGDGWGPLCRALSLEVPDEPFPHLDKNQRREPTILFSPQPGSAAALKLVALYPVAVAGDVERGRVGLTPVRADVSGFREITPRPRVGDRIVHVKLARDPAGLSAYARDGQIQPRLAPGVAAFVCVVHPVEMPHRR